MSNARAEPVITIHHFTKGQTPFMRFWEAVNAILRSRGQPEMLYGEARDWYAERMDGWRS